MPGQLSPSPFLADRGRPSPFSAGLAVVSLLVTLVMASGIWESYYPDPEAESLAARKAYYEKVLKKADVSWHEASHYRVAGEPAPGGRR